MDEKLMADHEFSLIFDKINLLNINPKCCLIKYNHPLFQSEEPGLKITFVNQDPKESEDEYIEETGEVWSLPKRAKGEISRLIENIPIEIELWRNGLQLGIGKSNFWYKILPL